jgi:hypothetical protein
MSKLFTVTAHFDFVVVAEDIGDAIEVAQQSARDALSDISSFDLDFDVHPGVHANGWDDECIPYGGDGNTRTGEYRAKQGETK